MQWICSNCISDLWFLTNIKLWIVLAAVYRNIVNIIYINRIDRNMRRCFFETTMFVKCSFWFFDANAKLATVIIYIMVFFKFIFSFIPPKLMKNNSGELVLQYFGTISIVEVINDRNFSNINMILPWFLPKKIDMRNQFFKEFNSKKKSCCL
jgi:hypothetical protein